MMVAVGVVISPILRVEGMCPMAHLINITMAVFMGPWYSFLCALAIGLIRMAVMGIPPLALTGAIFGATLSGILYRVSKGKIWAAVLGEIIGTGLIGSVLSYPVMTYLWGRTGLTWMFYVPSFLMGTIIGGSIAYILLKSMSRSGILENIQRKLGVQKFVENKRNNLIHCITNPISINDCANLILALGAKRLWLVTPMKLMISLAILRLWH